MYYMYSESTTCTVQCICGSGFQKTDDPDEHVTISEIISLGLVAKFGLRRIFREKLCPRIIVRVFSFTRHV